MGQAFRKLFDAFFGNKEMRVVMLGLDAAGKTTILFKLHIGEILSTVPTIVLYALSEASGFAGARSEQPGVHKMCLFKIQLKNVCRFGKPPSIIYVVDSADRERIGKAKAEFQAIVNDPLMRNSVILVFANKQDMKGAMSPAEVCDGLGLFDLRNRRWHIQGTCATKGEGLYEGLDWLAATLKELQAAGISTSVGGSAVR